MVKALSYKTIKYIPTELNKLVQVDFYQDIPKNISSQLLKNKHNPLLIVDKHIDKKIVKRIQKIISDCTHNITTYFLDSSEKKLDRVIDIWDQMIDLHPDVAIALGGGTTCDLVGFASSCYHRGLEHIFIPTTLLSMVDANIGGKTGIDFGKVKNSIGSIHYAVESYSFFSLLRSLPYDELISGFSEVIKAGMLFDNKLINDICLLKDHFQLDREWLSAISRGAELKARLCEQPMTDRSKLLYGHNIGHGVETYGNTHRRHGDCVSIGMNYELALAVIGGIVERNVWEQQNSLLRKFDLPTKLPADISIEKLIDSMKRYKLYKDEKFMFIIPKNPGQISQFKNTYYWRISEEKLKDYLLETIKMIGV